MWSGILSSSLHAQVIYEERNGVQYQVTRNVVQRQVPVTVMQSHPQTVYTRQWSTQLASQQMLYCVPKTQYHMVSHLHGLLNPFVRSYWTHEMKPVTTWHQQVATIQTPVSHMAWVPQIQNVQVPVTAYRTVEEETISRVAMNQPQSLTRPQSLIARGPSATLSASPIHGGGINANPIGGIALKNDPPRTATTRQSRY